MDLEILKIASDTKNHKVLKESSHFAKFKNPLCGDEMNVSLMVKGEKITDLLMNVNHVFTAKLQQVFCQKSL